uniref:Putative mRNA-capping enzyme P5 n=1 Tax=Rice dwarf virus (isolate Akita) TaxID=142803 RepID=MCE_RDVA|nr:RecName: Full=Putative mRNA-capping enzyme P5; AltName: Full=Structural protein 5; AltName: Full=mRNA guanylyltransferase [Rice dwarf virus (isolate Akita)]BAA14081.1 ORF [Rice dwarf virus]
MSNPDYCIPNFSQTVNERTIIDIFTICRYRSPLVVFCLSHNELAKKYAQDVSMSSGTHVHIIDGSVEITASLYRTFRTIATQLLGRMQIVVFVTVDKSVVSTQVMKSIAWAFRGSFVELRNQSVDSSTLVSKLENLVSFAPLYNVPKCGPDYYGPTVYSELLSLATNARTHWYATIDYSMFTRSVLTGFIAKYFNEEAVPIDKRIVSIVGYNPPYVWTCLRHGIRPTYIEKSLPNPGGKGPFGLILPVINELVLKSKVKYVMHNPQIKLLCLDTFMLSTSMNILYIGAYPATHLLSLQLNGWTILAFDPKITSDWTDAMAKATGAKVIGVNKEFDFKSFSVQANQLNMFQNSKLSVIDDTWVETDYEKFQAEKQAYFEWLIDRTSIDVRLISMKWNRSKDTSVSHLLALLPQPYGASIREMRAFFHKKGASDIKILAAETEKYMDDFTAMSVSDQINTQKFMHCMITTVGDALKMDLDGGRAVIASYSLSNSSNPKERVLKFLSDANKAKAMVVFGAPNTHRLAYAKKVGLVLDSAIKMSKDLITFSNPTGRRWRDYGYSQSELYDAGYVEITIDQMVAYSSDVYNGVGYFANSTYNDLFSWYIPKWYVHKRMLMQDIRLSPAALVKCFTTLIRNICYVPHETYYRFRGILVDKYLRSKNVDPSQYSIVGSGSKTFTVLNHFEVPHECGPLVFEASTDVNISGHLLSLAIAAHFVASPMILWAEQMKYMAVDRMLPPNLDKSLFFDNKVTPSGALQRWHSREEVLLAAEICESYAAMMLNNKHSPDIIGTLKSAINLVFKI